MIKRILDKPGLRNLKSTLKKLSFFFGLRPVVVKGKDSPDKYIPAGYKAVCLISADFEMAWASRYSKNYAQPLDKSINDGYLTRRNMPVILDICDKYNIPITWATVGHLFLTECHAEKGVKHPELPRLPYFENDFWKFDKGDWFDYDPCTDYKTANAWYAPDIIKDILSRKTKHEIGCHTFSHIDCRDNVFSDEVFDAEIKACLSLAKDKGLKLKSFVHPGHTIGHLDNLRKSGFTNYRTDFEDSLCYPEKDASGLWNFKNTAQIDEEAGWSIADSSAKYCRIIDKAIKSKTVCNLWFHPQINSFEFVKEVFEKLMLHLNGKRNEIYISTMAQYVDCLNKE